MFKARYFDSESNNWLTVHASSYDAAVHGTNLRCGDSQCDAEMYFVDEFKAQGSVDVPKHFRSKSQSDHIENCTAHKLSVQERNSISLKEALRAKLPVLCNLNLSLGHPHEGMFGSVRDAEKIMSPYNEWRKENVHGTDRARTVDEVFALFEEMDAADDSARLRTQFGHAQDIASYEKFRVVAKQGLVDVYRELHNAARADGWKPGAVLHGFARLIDFYPNEHEQDGRYYNPDQISGSAVRLATPSGPLILSNTLILKDPSLRERFTTHSCYQVMAVPYFARDEFRQAVLDAKAGEKAYTNQRWVIESEDQFRPAPGAHEYGTDPQMKLFDDDQPQAA